MFRRNRLLRVAHRIAAGLFGTCLSTATSVAYAQQPVDAQWPTALGNPGGMRYSDLNDITRDNVRGLQVKWTYRHTDFRSGWPESMVKGTAFEATPILADGRLIFPTPFNRVIALDPQTGRELWTYDPQIDLDRRYPNKMVSRGVAFWRDAARPGSACAGRIFLATLDARLIALDVTTGRPCADFGTSGQIDLTHGIEGLVDPWEYNVTSSPAVVGDFIVVGSSIADMIRRIQPSGAVRAFDARNGKLVWRFDTIPRSGDPAVETWELGSWRTHGGANVWSMITVDTERGWIFLPVSGAGPDHYGGDRPGSNLYTDSVVALDGRTGKRVWHFQTVHHDLWDYDLAAPPMLVRLRRNARDIDAVVQLTKSGFVFVLDRVTGAPLFPVEERPAPVSDVPGERTWPTQPFPLQPPALIPQHLTESDLWDATPQHREACREKLRKLRNDGIFTPPSTQGSLIYPGLAGGVNWPGGAFDPQRGLLVVPVNNTAFETYLDPLPADNYDHTDGVVLHSRFHALRWLITGKRTGLRYHMMRRKLFAHNGVPCIRPPWGMLVAVDLEHGEIKWRVPLGVAKDGTQGTFNMGPALVTAGALAFIGGSADRKLRAFDVETGEIAATFDLPAGLHGGPMTYRIGQTQYLVVAPGGHAGMDSKLGGWVMAYTLPYKVAGVRDGGAP